MGATVFSLKIEKIAPSSKYSAAYNLAWWGFHKMLKDFIGTSEPPIAEYIDEFASLAGQQHYRHGKRPYNQKRFDYCFPDLLGSDSCAADLTEHYFMIALAMWSSDNAVV